MGSNVGRDIFHYIWLFVVFVTIYVSHHSNSDTTSLYWNRVGNGILALVSVVFVLAVYTAALGARRYLAEKKKQERKNNESPSRDEVPPLK